MATFTQRAGREDGLPKNASWGIVYLEAMSLCRAAHLSHVFDGQRYDNGTIGTMQRGESWYCVVLITQSTTREVPVLWGSLNHNALFFNADLVS